LFNYRADIDGLRAVAVLSVLLYHVEISLFSGGFVGVDIFFTISGFLITNIVLKGLSNDSFSFKSFYIKRAARLLPAYLVVLFFVTLSGWFILAPLAFKGLLQSALASTVFSSNFYFLFFHGGYFATSAHELPLLHTWSLAVEEQFYIIMPALLYLWVKLKNSRTQLVYFLIALVGSIFVSYLLTSINQSAAYYLVFSRAHEFLLGAVLSIFLFVKTDKMFPSVTISNILFVVGFILISYSIATIEAKSSFPGILAVIPCLGTLLIIYSGMNQQCISHKVLGNGVIVFVGLLSYSLYLWHWPFVAYLKYVGLDFTAVIQLSVIFMSFICAYLSWRFVEKPFRYAKFSKTGSVALILYIAPAALLFCFIFSMKSSYFSLPVAQEVASLEKAVKSKPEEGREACHSATFSLDDECQYRKGQNNTLNAVLWGDSHASHFSGFVKELASSYSMNVIDSTMGSCPPLPDLYIDADGARGACISKNADVYNYIIASDIDVVFLAGAWDGYLKGNLLTQSAMEGKSKFIKQQVEVLVKRLTDKGIKVVIFTSLPRSSSDLSQCYTKKLQFPSINSGKVCQFTLMPKQIDVNNTIRGLISDRVHVIDSAALFCHNKLCETVIDETPLYRDNNHLNQMGSVYLGQFYIKKFDDVFSAFLAKGAH